jgi:hypothetical protein
MTSGAIIDTRSKIFFFLLVAVLGFEPRALSLQGRSSVAEPGLSSPPEANLKHRK